MKILPILSSLFVILATSATAGDVESNATDYIARRGDGVVSHDMFDARASRIPEHDRQVVLRDRKRLQDLLGDLLLTAQVVADARAAKLDQDPEVIARMQLAADEELAKAWLQHVASGGESADYRAMAHEYYLVNPEMFKSEKTVDLTHILIGTKQRSEEEALLLAQQLRQWIMDAPASFDSLVLEYSDDPGAAANKGHYMKVRKGQMEQAFEQAAFAMTVQQVSEPVKTPYGYHLIRLDGINESKPQSFEEVEDMLVDRVRRRHEESMQNDYLSQLTSLPVEIPEAALEEMVRRHFGEDAVREQPTE